jgi:ketosteroid isomerase-like protein
MSQANVELVRKAFDHWNRGEGNLLSAFHPDLEYRPRRVATEGVYRGIAGIEKFDADTKEIFDKFEPHIELLDLGERVLVWGSIHMRARGSGIETDVSMGGLVEFRDEKILRWEDFGSKEQALEAAGARG